ncbi:hypothetical protein [Sideroxydans lithotrophicus]|uniref:GIY-YIG domain-containing protein n=1 Tax=Sideroxydans lithotrophicus (strain ES-1) TaxID=580332 RepID=D5CTJ5_SIDLE|nr:hypothetical protein [Sideroxydans lithotrophicus]ADE10301.1 conserved hypothetical protein [Sideroxydans lithotrophicus ES-1]
MKASELLDAIKNKVGISTDQKLAAYLGMTQPALVAWRSQKTLSPLQITNAIVKAKAASKKEAHHLAIKPIVEFFPISTVEVGNAGKMEIFETGKEARQHENGLKKVLENSKGLYIFYDTRGKALYAGQTKKQNLWKELHNAFNRTRSAQVITLVRHPVNDTTFNPAVEKNKQPHDKNLKLHDLAAYFSAYEVADGMIDDLEALLVRVFPNDLLNSKMEKFGKASNKKKASVSKPAKKQTRPVKRKTK